MSFTTRFLDDIRARIGLADVIGKSVKLTRKGREHSGLCPFHNEKTPSFTVNEEKGFYHCFGCGAHGDILSFVMNTQGLSFPEAVERLASDAGLEIPEETPADRRAAEKRASLYDVVEAAAQWFQQQLRSTAGRNALNYLRERGVSDEAIAQFRLGYAPDVKGALEEALSKKNIKPEQLFEPGLLRQPDDGRAPYAFFRDRIIFPIMDRRGRVIAFGGRLMGDAKAAKYLNSPESPLFDKGRTLYNMSNARKAAHESNEVIVTEGYMDVIALSDAGIHAAVAPLGTAMTEDQLRELWRLGPEPIMCFDGDAAGQKAAGRAAVRALPELRPGKSLRFAIMPPGEDPDSLIKSQGNKAFLQLLQGAKPLSDMIWDMEFNIRPVNTPERRADFEQRLFAQVKSIGDGAVQEHYRTAFKERIWSSTRRTKTANGKTSRFNLRGSQNMARDVLSSTTALRAKRRKQQAILATIVNHPPLRDEFDEALTIFEFDPDLDKLRQQLQNVFAETWDLDLDGIRSHFEKSGSAIALNGVLDRQVLLHAPFARHDASLEDARKGMRSLIGREMLKRQQDEQKHLGRTTEDEARVFAAGQETIENHRHLADIDDV